MIGITPDKSSIVHLNSPHRLYPLGMHRNNQSRTAIRPDYIVARSKVSHRPPPLRREYRLTDWFRFPGTGTPATEVRAIWSFRRVDTLQSPTETEVLVWIQAATVGCGESLDVQGCSPAFIAVEDGPTGLAEKHCVAITLELLYKVSQDEGLVQDQVSTKPIPVLLVKNLFGLHRLKDQLALPVWAFLHHHQRVWIDL